MSTLPLVKILIYTCRDEIQATIVDNCIGGFYMTLVVNVFRCSKLVQKLLLAASTNGAVRDFYF